MEFNFLFIRELLFVLIFVVSVLYQFILFFSLWRNRKAINFTSAVIKKDGTVSKSGVMFFVLMAIITYQSLFLNSITDGLMGILGLIIASDLGGRAVDVWTGQFPGEKKQKHSRKVKLDEDQQPFVAGE